MVVRHREALKWLGSDERIDLFINRVNEVYYIQTGEELEVATAYRLVKILIGVLLPKEYRQDGRAYPSPKQVIRLIMNDACFEALKAVLSVFPFVDRYNAWLIMQAVDEAKEDPTLSASYAVQKVLQVRGEEI